MPRAWLKFKLDFRADEARALLALLDAHRFDVAEKDRDRMDRLRARLVRGLAWMDKQRAERSEAGDAA